MEMRDDRTGHQTDPARRYPRDFAIVAWVIIGLIVLETVIREF